MAILGITPWGKFKLLNKLDDGLNAIMEARAARRTVSCLAGTAHSFPAGTKVLMADGTSRPIEQIKSGDLVTATNPTTDETGPRRVTRTIHTPDDRDFTKVTLADGSAVTSTSSHPYWSENNHAWKNASDLQAGDTLHTSRNSTAAITSVRSWKGLQDAYDLTVEDLHTYYVSTGKLNVLVHNTNAGCNDWVVAAWKKLPKRVYGDPTSAYVFRPDGTKLWESQLKSGKSPLSEKINEYLRTSEDFPPFSSYAEVSHHAEVKLAWKMREEMGPGELHIVINNNYVCPRVWTPNAMGCRQAVPAILYNDQTIKVYYPGMKDPVTLKGTQVREKPEAS